MYGHNITSATAVTVPKRLVSNQLYCKHNTRLELIFLTYMTRQIIGCHLKLRRTTKFETAQVLYKRIKIKINVSV